MLNYLTKFSKDQEVLIKEGFFKGRVGVVTDYMSGGRQGFVGDNESRKNNIDGYQGTYTIKLGHGIFSKEVVCLEQSLEEFNG